MLSSRLKRTFATAAILAGVFTMPALAQDAGADSPDSQPSAGDILDQMADTPMAVPVESGAQFLKDDHDIALARGAESHGGILYVFQKDNTIRLGLETDTARGRGFRVLTQGPLLETNHPDAPPAPTVDVAESAHGQDACMSAQEALDTWGKPVVGFLNEDGTKLFQLFSFAVGPKPWVLAVTPAATQKTCPIMNGASFQTTVAFAQGTGVAPTVRHQASPTVPELKPDTTGPQISPSLKLQ